MTNLRTQSKHPDSTLVEGYLEQILESMLEEPSTIVFSGHSSTYEPDRSWIVVADPVLNQIGISFPGKVKDQLFFSCLVNFAESLQFRTGGSYRICAGFKEVFPIREEIYHLWTSDNVPLEIRVAIPGRLTPEIVPNGTVFSNLSSKISQSIDLYLSKKDSGDSTEKASVSVRIVGWHAAKVFDVCLTKDGGSIEMKMTEQSETENRLESELYLGKLLISYQELVDLRRGSEIKIDADPSFKALLRVGETTWAVGELSLGPESCSFKIESLPLIEGKLFENWVEQSDRRVENENSIEPDNSTCI